MQTRLQVCERSLKDVEDRLIKLNSSDSLAAGEEQTISESLQLIRKALDAVSEARKRVDHLRSKRLTASA